MLAGGFTKLKGGAWKGLELRCAESVSGRLVALGCVRLRVSRPAGLDDEADALDPGDISDLPQ